LASIVSFVFQRQVTARRLSPYLKKLRWSWRVPTHVQLNKFTEENLWIYANYVDGIQDVPWDQLVFLDEAHVVSRLLHKKKVLGIVNQRTWVKAGDLHGKSFSITVLTRICDKRPLFVDIREESNTQWDFLLVVVLALKAQFLQHGNYLVVDNACVHGGGETMHLLMAILDAAGVRLIFLPAYSPELNPPEHVFNIMKSYLRNKRNRQNPIWVEALHGLARVTVRDMIGFYYQCISLLFVPAAHTVRMTDWEILY